MGIHLELNEFCLTRPLHICMIYGHAKACTYLNNKVFEGECYGRYKRKRK
jgi:hypothetical protein